MSKNTDLIAKSGEEELQKQLDVLQVQSDKFKKELERLETDPRIYRRRIDQLESKIKRLNKKIFPRLNKINKIRGETAEFRPLESKIEDSSKECDNLKLAECGSYTI